MTPRPYLSQSQLVLFEQSPEKYLERYLDDKQMRANKNMLYGSKLANGLENDEATGDPLLDMMMAKMPKFERMDLPVEDSRGTEVSYRKGKTAHIPILWDGKVAIPLLALPDTATSDYRAFKEYKSSVKKWTQEQVDESAQVTFYATAIHCATGFIPDDIELVCVIVAYEDDGSLQPTGEMYVYKTKRTMVDILKMRKRIKKCWRSINELFDKELL